LIHGKRTFDARLLFIMLDMRSEQTYKTYILRVWHVERDALPVMVAVLEECQTEERTTFPSLAALVAFLKSGCDTGQPVADGPQPSDDAQSLYGRLGEVSGLSSHK
jgi:hypothetical protein